ncbi:MAG: SDR family NAD(P)-dependent oxidoreductase [Paracoccaceae bacterium]
MQRFEGMCAVVTGAGSGIGAATARRFAADGAAVVLAGRRLERLAQVAADLPAERTLCHAADVSDRAAVDALVAAALERFGRIDTLVNNAGIAKTGRLDDFSSEDWQQIIDIDLTALFHTCQAALPALRAAGGQGSIVNVSSVSGLGGDWGLFAYNAAKGGVSNLTRALALELAPEVRANAVAPSLTLTDMTAGMKDNADLLAAFADRIPMGRGAEPEEVADVIAFLASRDARFVNGVVLPADGGLGASNGQPRIA